MGSNKTSLSGTFDFGLNARTKAFSLKCPGFPRLTVEPSATFDEREAVPISWSAVRIEAEEKVFMARTSDGEWTLRFRPSSERSAAELSLALRLSKPFQDVRLAPLSVQRIPADHLLTHGRKMGGCGLFLLKKGIHKPFASDFLIALTRANRTLQFSHPMAQGEISQFDGCMGGKAIRDFRASTRFQPCGSRRIQSAAVTIRSSGNGQQLMLDWADAQMAGPELRDVPQESGWNSWDYYRWTISEDEVLRNAEYIASDPVLSRHVKRIIVDDGWQYCYGEWEPNFLFPSGMKSLSRKLRRMGFVPGLWFAPTIVEPHSRMAQMQPELLTRGAAGFPCLAFSCMERKGFLLDPSHPAVRRWWDELFRRYAGYGYRYFKLDFLAWTVRSRRFVDPTAKPGELMRRIVSPIRRAVGPDCRILGCNYNLEYVPGLVDEVRVSSDIHSRWDSVKENVASIATRFWAHRRFWINDPDFALCRGDETSDDPGLHRLKALLPFVRPEDPNPDGVDYMSSLVDLGVREAEVLLSLVIISGGAMNLSDNLTRLNAKGLGLLRKAVAAEKGNAAIPLDLFRSELPSIWIQKLDSGVHRTLLVNWSERRARLGADLDAANVPRRHARNFWTGEPVVVRRGRLSVALPPHSCLLVESKS